MLTAQNATPANLACAIALLYLLGMEFHAPLLEAVGCDNIALSMLLPGQAPPLCRLDETHRPAILVVGDDCDATRFGPDGWKSSQRMMRWAGATMIHGAAGAVEHYEVAIAGAILHRRLLLIETASWRVDAWSGLAQRLMPPQRILEIRPGGGGFHPTTADPQVVQ